MQVSAEASDGEEKPGESSGQGLLRSKYPQGLPQALLTPRHCLKAWDIQPLIKSSL